MCRDQPSSQRHLWSDDSHLADRLALRHLSGLGMCGHWRILADAGVGRPNGDEIKTRKTHFGGLVLGCSNADLCVQILILQHFLFFEIHKIIKVDFPFLQIFNAFAPFFVSKIFSYFVFFWVKLQWSKTFFSLKYQWKFVGLSQNNRYIKDFDESDTKSAVFSGIYFQKISIFDVRVSFIFSMGLLLLSPR